MISLAVGPSRRGRGQVKALWRHPPAPPIDWNRKAAARNNPMPMVGPLKLKAQLLCGDELAMGPGKADLLEAIRTEGSISAAGRKLGMSYRRTWLLVDTMNRCWAQPLVDATPGGGESRGTRLTP